MNGFLCDFLSKRCQYCLLRIILKYWNAIFTCSVFPRSITGIFPVVYLFSYILHLLYGCCCCCCCCDTLKKTCCARGHFGKWAETRNSNSKRARERESDREMRKIDEPNSWMFERWRAVLILWKQAIIWYIRAHFMNEWREFSKIKHPSMVRIITKKTTGPSINDMGEYAKGWTRKKKLNDTCKNVLNFQLLDMPREEKREQNFGYHYFKFLCFAHNDSVYQWWC